MSLRRRRARPLLGTMVEISVLTEDLAVADRALELAFKEIERIQDLLSFHDPESEISMLNSHGRVRGSADLRRLLTFSQEMWERTHGTFNVAVAPSLIREGYLPSPMGRNFESGTAMDYLVGESEITLQKPVALDLGGVAKGYAVDQAIEILREHGFASAIVIAGGDLRAYGELRDFFIRNPQNPKLLESFGAGEDLALATSAGYFSDPESHGGYLPYVNKSHECIRMMPSVTVAAPTCMMADALTKYVLFGQPSVEQLAQFSAYSVVRA